MKYLEQGQVLTLEDNNKYVVIDSKIYEDNNYIYVININEPKDQLIALVTKENDDISVKTLDYQCQENKELIKNLSNIFIESILEFIGLEV